MNGKIEIMTRVIRTARLSSLIVLSLCLSANADEKAVPHGHAGVVSGLGARNSGSATMSSTVK